ncbi:hypothetical protein J6590_037133 [Homalodisca vitripennis]|nr:hypothetical protein J6590_037133 [Homalodisca vitripennis]
MCLRLDLPPTRITHNTRSSVDSACTISEEKLIINAQLSDHTVQPCTAQAQIEDPRSNNMNQSLKSENLRDLKLLLSNESLEELLKAPTTNKAHSLINNTLQLALNSACPWKNRQPRAKTKPRHLADEEVYRLRTSYLTAQEQYELTGNHINKVEVAQNKKAYDQWQKMIRQQTSHNINEDENKSKAAWEIINNARNKIAEDTLQQIPNSECKKLSITNLHPQTNQSTTPDTDINEVRATISSLKPKTSAGTVEISSKTIRFWADKLTTSLKAIFNNSFREGIIR